MDQRNENLTVTETAVETVAETNTETNTETGTDTAAAPVIERNFRLGGKNRTLLFIGSLLLLLPVVACYYACTKQFWLAGQVDGVIARVGLNDVMYSGGAGFMLEVYSLFHVGSPDGSTMGLITVIALLVTTFFKVLPFTFAFASGMNTQAKKNLYSFLNGLSIFVLSVYWIVGIGVELYEYNRSGYIGNNIHYSIWFIARNVYAAAGTAAVKNCFGNTVLIRMTAAKCRRFGIAALVISALAVALATGNSVYHGHGIDSGVGAFLFVMISRLICFPWLAIFLINIARENDTSKSTVEDKKTYYAIHRINRQSSKAVTTTAIAIIAFEVFFLIYAVITNGR